MKIKIETFVSLYKMSRGIERGEKWINVCAGSHLCNHAFIALKFTLTRRIAGDKLWRARERNWDPQQVALENANNRPCWPCLHVERDRESPVVRSVAGVSLFLLKDVSLVCRPSDLAKLILNRARREHFQRRIKKQTPDVSLRFKFHTTIVESNLKQFYRSTKSRGFAYSEFQFKLPLNMSAKYPESMVLSWSFQPSWYKQTEISSIRDSRWCSRTNFGSTSLVDG